MNYEEIIDKSKPTFVCPRSEGSSLRNVFPEGDVWEIDGSCSWCGSLHPDILMARLRAGDVSINPTDKSYKIYVLNKGGEQFKQAYRECPADSGCVDHKHCTHWVERSVDQTKFYFQHLSQEQREEFIQLYNDGKIQMGYPGYFYTLPFFCTRVNTQ